MVICKPQLCFNSRDNEWGRKDLQPLHHLLFCGSKKPSFAILFPSDKLDRIAGAYRNLTLRLSDRELLKARDEVLQQYCRLF